MCSQLRMRPLVLFYERNAPTYCDICMAPSVFAVYNRFVGLFVCHLMHCVSGLTSQTRVCSECVRRIDLDTLLSVDNLIMGDLTLRAATNFVRYSFVLF
jgi:hypothetical protein